MIHFDDYHRNALSTFNDLKKSKEEILEFAETIYGTLKKGNKILVAGNGGLCAEAEHFCGELTCTFNNPNRRAFPAISLTQNNSSITAWANDFGYDSYFTRMVDAFGKDGDIILLLSTGGGDIENNLSMNLVKCVDNAKNLNMKVLSIIGKSGGDLKKISDKFILINSHTTSHIQEATLMICHYICSYIDQKIINE